MGSNPTVSNSNISFSSLKSSYVDGSITSADGNSNLTDGKTNTPISLSLFRNATFTDSTSIPSSGEISVNDDFKGKTYGASATPQFDWHYYAYGSNIGTIYIYWLNSSNNSLNLLRSITGQQHTGSTQSWNNYEEDLSSYSGQTGRIVIAYKTGSSFRQDIQLDDMELRETTEVGGTINLNPGTFLGRGNWQRKTSYTTNLSYPTSGWSSISISTSSSKIWNYDAGGTPSGSTGGTRDVSGSTSGYYLYFEGSSPNFSSSNRYYWLRTGEYTLSGGDGGGGGGGGGSSPK